MRRAKPAKPDPKGDEMFDANAYAPDEADAPLDAATLSGDIRDVLLSHMRAMNVPWAMLSEDEQRDKIEAVTRCAETLVRRTVLTLATADFPAIAVSLGAIKFDKGIEVKFACAPTIENITRLALHGHGTAVLVLAEAADYFGERAAARPQKNQPDLPLDDAAE